MNTNGESVCTRCGVVDETHTRGTGCKTCGASSFAMRPVGAAVVVAAPPPPKPVKIYEGARYEIPY